MGELRGMRRAAANSGGRVASVGLAGVAALAVLAAAIEPRRSRANAVWEWDDIATARAALVVGTISVLIGIAIAVPPSRTWSTRSGRRLAAQVVLAGSP